MKKIKYSRRRFISETAMSLGAAEFAMFGFTNTSFIDNNGKKIMNSNNKENLFDTIKQIDAGLLNVGYAEAGPLNGTPVILLHGWPYDIYSFVDVTPLLVSAGYRVIIPYLRGYGTTRFLSDDTLRNGQQSVIAVDIINLMDALKITKAIIAGFDWGARTACIIAALWPQRCKAVVSVSGYLIGNQEAGKMPLPPKLNFNGGINIILLRSEDE